MRVLLDEVVAVAVDVVVVEEVGAAGVETEAGVEAEGFPIGGGAIIIGGGVADGADNGVLNSGAGGIFWGRPKGSQRKSTGAFGSKGAGGGGGGWRGSATKGGDDGEVVDVIRGGDEDGDGGAESVVSLSSSMTEEPT